MDTFIYDKYVTGRNFLGRKKDCTLLAGMISAGCHVCIYEPPKAGKMSVIQQTLFDMRIHGKMFSVGQFSLLNVRSGEAFLTRFGTTVLRIVASTPDEFDSLIARHLGGTHFYFDRTRYKDSDTVVSVNGEIDAEDIRRMLLLPQRIAVESNLQMVLIMTEFQNLDFAEEAEKIYKVFEKVLDQMMTEGTRCSFIFSGSMHNAMHDIFGVRKFFYRRVERLRLSPVEEKDIVEYIIKGLSSGGKVVERDLLFGVCGLFRCNLWYINHFIAICDSLSRGYITNATLMQALEMIISIHEPRMKAVMNSLTTFQVRLLKAILDGHNKFSAAEVIAEYGLNSSANVKRLKDALVKKEIVASGLGSEDAVLLDPLFDYWVRKYWFGMQV